MQSLKQKKFCMDFLFLNLKEMVLLVSQFHFLVLWLCRRFFMFFLLCIGSPVWSLSSLFPFVSFQTQSLSPLGIGAF